MAIREVDIYQARLMLNSLKQAPPAYNFLQKTFFGKTVRHTTETVELDIYKGKRKIAAFVNPIKSGRIVEREGFETYTTRPAYIKEKMQIKPLDLQTRVMGTNAYDAINPAQRVGQILGENMATLDERILRREELMCAQALFEGKVIVKGDGWDSQVDFGYTTGNTQEDNIKVLSGADTWDKPNSNPLQDLDRWRREINRRCGIQPNICIVSYDVGWALLENKKIRKMLDIQNMNIGNMSPNKREGGISSFGNILLPSGQVELISYDELYTDPNTGSDTELVPAGTVLLGSTDARCEFHYGMIQNMHSLQPIPRFPHVWTEDDGSARWMQLESAPMPNIFQVGAFTVAKVMEAA